MNIEHVYLSQADFKSEPIMTLCPLGVSRLPDVSVGAPLLSFVLTRAGEINIQWQPHNFLYMPWDCSKLENLILKRISGSVALLPVALAQQRTTHSNKIKENDATKKNYLIYYTYATYHSSVRGRRALILRAKLRLCR